MNIKIVTPQNILEPGAGSRLKLLKIIQSFPGIRNNDLIRTIGFNNGTLSHHLATLEKNSIIKILRLENSNITRYFSASITKEEAIIIGFLKIKSTSQIINMLIDSHQLSFLEIIQSIKKSPLTTSWNLKRLLEVNIVKRSKLDHVYIYQLNNPETIKRLINNSNHTLFDRSVDNFSNLIEGL